MTIKNNMNILPFELPLFIYAEYINEKEEKKEAHIQTRDIHGVQDCKIGDFSANWWIRPRKAKKSIPYKTIGDYKRAVKLSMQKQTGCKVTKIYQKQNIDGVDYEINI
jgi:hypothetical protein